MAEESIERRIADHVDANRDAMVGFLQEVVRVPSVWGDVAQLSRLGRLVGATLEAGGVAAEYPDSGTPGAPNVLARTGEGTSNRTLLLCGHIDVYPPSKAWRFDPFSAPIQDGRLYGAGAADMKGGTAAMVQAMIVLAKLGLPKGGRVAALAVPNHFEGGLGTRRALDAGLTAEAGIVCEPTDLDICAAQRGILYLDVRVTGVGAHTTAGHIGVNAIEKATKVIAAVQSPAFRRPDHDAYGDEKIVNVAMISGGLRRCLIPEACTLTIDIRFSPSTTQAKVLAEVRALLDGIAAADPKFHAEAAPQESCVENPRSPMAWVEHPIRDAVAESHARFAGTEARLACHPAWPDTPVMGERGIPSITYGPGSKFCYWDEEFVPLPEYLQAIRVYAATAARWFERG